ncbi:hypothetical protein INP36_13465, partial [Staphylococcus aureus]|nr:hypothetical protein [Staphylococcus aureus]
MNLVVRQSGDNEWDSTLVGGAQPAHLDGRQLVVGGRDGEKCGGRVEGFFGHQTTLGEFN